MSEDELREQLLADPHTQQIAASLGVDLETYIDEVLHFATHPDEEPELAYLDDSVDPINALAVENFFDRCARPDAFGPSAEEKRQQDLEAMLLRGQHAAARRAYEITGRVSWEAASRISPVRGRALGAANINTQTRR